MSRLIDADALKAHIDKLPALPDGNFAGTHSALKALINMQPTIDAVPVVRGKWRLYSPLTDTYECDKCGYQVIDESFRTNFCPNCGADIREEDDHE